MTSTAPQLSSEKIVQQSFRNHARDKSMWVGGTEKVSAPSVICVSQFNAEKLTFYEATNVGVSLGAINLLAEVFINAFDQATKFAKTGTNHIKISFNQDKKEFCVWNNGVGISLDKYKLPDGRDVYGPEYICVAERAGTKHERKDAVAASVVGTNGYGLKIVLANARYIDVSTYDAGKFYSQHLCINDSAAHDDASSYGDAPKIVATKTPPHIGTQFVVRLDYERFYGGTKLFSAQDFAKIEVILLFRIVCYTMQHSNVCVEYKGNNQHQWINLTQYLQILATNMQLRNAFAAIAHELAKTMCYTTRVCAVHTMQPICARIDDAEKSRVIAFNPVFVFGLPGCKKRQGFGIVNGQNCTGGYINTLRDQISMHVDKKLCEMITAKYGEQLCGQLNVTNTLNGVYMALRVELDNPPFSDQTKTLLKHFPKYTFTPAANDINTLARTIFEMAEAAGEYTALIKKQTVMSISATRITKKHYQEFSTSSRRLVIVEGDSAATVVTRGLGTSSSIFNLVGVPLNPLKTQQTKVGDAYLLNEYALNDMMKNNTGLMTFFKVMEKIDFVKAASVPSGFKFDEIILLTDEDMDGIGKICSMVIMWIYLYYPILFREGRVYRMRTPLYWITCGTKSWPAYTKTQYEEIIAKFDDPTKYTVTYCKGLASNSKTQSRLAFNAESIKRERILITLDNAQDYIRKVFVCFYGRDPTFRKQITSGEHITAQYRERVLAKIEREKKIGADEHILLHGGDAAIGIAKRGIRAYSDGLTPTQRKVFATAFKHAVRLSRPMKIFAFGGHVSGEMGYHQGNASLDDVIFNLARDYAGTNLLQFFIGEGETGSRYKGGHDAGSSRYVAIRFNSRLAAAMFPQTDIFEYVEDDGEFYEPVTYYSVIPYVAMLHIHTTVPGWQQSFAPRDVRQLVRYVVQKIVAVDNDCKLNVPKNIDCAADGALSMSAYKFNGHIQTFYARESKVANAATLTLPVRMKEEWQIGNLELTKLYNGNIRAKITELPFNQLCPYDYIYGSGQASADDQVVEKKRGASKKEVARVEPTKQQSRWCGLRNVNTVYKTEIIANPETLSFSGNDIDQIDIQFDITPQGAKFIESTCEVPEILAKHCSDSVSKFHKFFRLLHKCKMQINCFHEETQRVVSYKSFEDLIDSWYKLREAKYIERVARDLFYYKCLREVLENLRGFYEAVTSGKIVISTSIVEDEYQRILLANGFVRLNNAALSRYAQKSLATLREQWSNEKKKSFDYITHLRWNKISKNEFERITRELTECKAMIAKISAPKYYLQLWLDEISALVAEIIVAAPGLY